jgi:hypothetical protein
LATENVQQIVGKVFTRTYNFALDANSIEVCSESYETSKLQESKIARFQDSHAGVPGQKSHLDATPVTSHRMNPLRGRRQQPLQSLEKLIKYKGGEQAPRNGSLTLPKDPAVKPFGVKGLLNV